MLEPKISESPTLKIIAADLLITKFAACNLKPVNLWLIIER